ncbi:exosome nuclease subunit RRP6 [Sporobolomyces koalae]|uniref:exosome nuclease subunit RRP6 n=1 Tax=Sporobolomyces koalae TaxID=500713 RepID=UPI00317BB426
MELQPMLNALQAALIPPTRSAAQLPEASDLSFERTLSRQLARTLDAESHKLLSLAQRLLDWTRPEGTARVALDDDLLRDGEYSNPTVHVEQLLEQADDYIDKHLGLGKHRLQKGAIGAKSHEEMQDRQLKRAKLERLPAKLLHDSTLPKPQLDFTKRTQVSPTEIGAENADLPLWKPILTRKLNPLQAGLDEGWLETERYEPTSKFTSITDTHPPAYTRYVHPYKHELEHLKPPSTLLEVPSEPPRAIPKDSFETTPFEWVGDEKALDKMVGEIRQIGEHDGLKELAIDLEHHDFRSWSGFTCLIQLSTRKKDYVIDAINPGVREHLEDLNEFLTDPTWIKVLHGANSDIVWLQRDFGLYIVGLFDTYHATHVLGYAQHSLASLLDMYTDFEPDKRYQLADWRIRPLPKEMLHYARSDTHYLLTIYDHLRLALANKHLSSDEDVTPALEEVFNRSIAVSSTVFSIAPYDDLTGHFDSGFLIPLAKSGQLKSYATARAVPTLPIKTGWGPGELKLEVLRAVMRWRESVAREEDESTRYVVGLNGVLQLVELCKRIRQGGSQELIRVLGEARGGVSEVARRRKDELVQVITETIERVDGATSSDMQEDHDMARVGGFGTLSGLPAFEPAVKPVEGLWDSSSSAVASTSSSTFFGGSAASSTAIITAATSSFFGPGPVASNMMSKNGKGKQVVRLSQGDRSAAVQKVHDSLVLGGGLAQSLQPHRLPTAAATTPAANESEPARAAAVDPSTLPIALEVPDSSFVPFDSKSNTNAKAIGSTSHSVPVPKDSDVIVVSSLKDKPSRNAQNQAKKRRRAGTDLEPSSTRLDESVVTPSEIATSPPPQPPQAKKQKKKKSKDAAREPAAPVVPHDYTGSTSLLDAGPAAVLSGLERREAEKKQKKKDKVAAGGSGKGFKVDTSEHKRPMRVNNAPKSANVSKTF